MKRWIRALAFLMMLILLAGVLPVPIYPLKASASEPVVEVPERKAIPSIEEQIRAFAKSINQSNADDSAAKALANHGVTGGGKKLSVGKSHALTATLMNSNLMLDVLINGCARAIQWMNKSGKDTLLVHATSGWYSSDFSSGLYFFKNKDDADKFVNLIDHKRVRTTTGNAYDNSLTWIGGSVLTQITMKQTKVTANEVIYDVKIVSSDRFDFRGTNGAIHDDIASILGSIFFREFDWESTVTLQLTVPNECEHFYKSQTTAPTCAAKGYTTHTCSCCGYSYKDTYTAKIDHKFGSWKKTASPTCVGKGTETRTCSGCGATETRATAALGHSHTPAVTAPTCTAQGFTTHICHCGDTYTDSYVPAKGHSLGDWIESITPTCTEPGTETRGCMSCSYTEIREIPSKNHTYTTEITAPTCTKEGYTTYICTTCGYTDTNDFVQPAGHSYYSQVIAPTCTAQGYTIHTCTVCQNRHRDSFTTRLSHTPGDWIIDREPTSGAEGSKHKECITCGELLETAIIEPLPEVTEPETEAETVPGTEPETELETEFETEPETELETEPETEPETELETEPETELETEFETEPATEPETESATEPEAEPVETRPVPGTTPASEPNSTPEPEPSATETQPAGKKKGCAGTVQPELFLQMIAWLPVVVIKRKKETE